MQHDGVEEVPFPPRKGQVQLNIHKGRSTPPGIQKTCLQGHHQTPSPRTARHDGHNRQSGVVALVGDGGVPLLVCGGGD